MLDVVALGELLIDFTSEKVDDMGYPTMTAHPGGAPANFLAALAKYGASAAMLGKVGNDAFGRQLVKTLSDAGINTEGMIIADDVFTTLAFVTLDENGDREFSFARKPGADTQISFEEIDLSIINDAKVFHFGTLSLTHEPARTATYKAVEYAKSCGCMISFDPNLRRPLWNDLEDARREMLWGLKQADVVKISDEEGEFLFGTTPEQTADIVINKYGAALVFVTCGAEGCVYKTARVSGKACSNVSVKAIDTTGAGDIFGGAAMSRILALGKAPAELNADELSEIARFACTAASISVTKHGGITSVPELDMVLQN